MKVCWQVTGVRRDAWAEANRIPVEEVKPVGEKGNYLHPELFEKKVTPRTRRSVDTMAAVLPDQIRRHAAEVLAQPGRPGFGELVTRPARMFAQRVTERRESAERSSGTVGVMSMLSDLGGVRAGLGRALFGLVAGPEGPGNRAPYPRHTRPTLVR